MDSTAQTTHVASEIINETASTGDAWIGQRKQSMGPQKSSTKLLPRVTRGLDSANSPWGLRNHQRNCFHGSRLDSTAQTAPAASEIFNENASTSDEWIQQRKQPLGLQKSSTKLLQRVTHAIDSANIPCGLGNHQRNRVTGDSKIINETASTGDAWIRQRKQPMGLQKSSTKLLLGVTHAIDSANIPCGLRNHQRNRVTGDSKIINETASMVTHGFDSANSPCGFRNHQRNCFHG